MMHTHWPWLWFLSNLLTGLSYVMIAIVIFRDGYMRMAHYPLFVCFVAACGAHHLVHVIPQIAGGHPGEPFTPIWLDALQMFVDATMTTVSVLTAMVKVRAHVWRRDA